MQVNGTNINSQLSRAIQGQTERLGEVQKKISSGRRWGERSEEPADASESRVLERQQGRIDQWKDNVTAANNFTKVTEGHLQSVTDNIQHLQELAVRGVNETTDDQVKQNLAKEIDSVIEDLVTISQEQFNGKYVFSGTYSDSPPISVTRDADGQITEVNANSNIEDWEKRSVQVHESSTRHFGALAGGKEGVFMDSAHDPSDGDLEPAGSIFDAALELRNTLQAGDTPSDSNVESLEKGLKRVTQGLVSNGVSQSSFEDMEERYQETTDSLNETLDKISGTDIAKASIQLNELRSSLMATMRMTSMTQDLNLAKYL